MEPLPKVHTEGDDKGKPSGVGPKHLQRLVLDTVTAVDTAAPDANTANKPWTPVKWDAFWPQDSVANKLNEDNVKIYSGKGDEVGNFRKYVTVGVRKSRESTGRPAFLKSHYFDRRRSPVFLTTRAKANGALQSQTAS